MINDNKISTWWKIYFRIIRQNKTLQFFVWFSKREFKFWNHLMILFVREWCFWRNDEKQIWKKWKRCFLSNSNFSQNFSYKMINVNRLIQWSIQNSFSHFKRFATEMCDIWVLFSKIIFLSFLMMNLRMINLIMIRFAIIRNLKCVILFTKKLFKKLIKNDWYSQNNCSIACSFDHETVIDWMFFLQIDSNIKIY